jgi:multiple sugar transport system permease protein
MATIAKAQTPVRSHHRSGLENFLRRLPLYLVVLLACALTGFPIYWMIVSAVQPVQYSFSFPPPLFPAEISLRPFETMFTQFPIWSWLKNTLLLAGLATIICTFMTILGAYTLSVLKWRGKTMFGFLLLMTQLLPEALIVIPVFAMYQSLGLRENIAALALMDAAFMIPIGTWILKNIFDSIPRDIYDAALIDGCSPLGVLWRIMVPIAAPGLVAVSVVAFFYAWNEYLFASNLIQNRELWPASVGMASLRSMLDTPIDLVLATGLFFSIFPVIFYMLVQRYVVTGLSAGAVKG